MRALTQLWSWPTSLALAVALLATGCATTQRDLVTLRGQVGQQRTSLRSAQSAADAGKAYTATIGKRSATKRLLLGRDAVLSAIKAHMPYAFDGRKLSKRISGQFTLNGARDFTFLSRNRARWRWDFKGKGVSVNVKGIPMAGAKDAREAKEALEGGGTLLMEGSVWVDNKKNVLRLNARCVSAALRRHNTGRNQGYVCDGANKKLFRAQQAVPLPSTLRGKAVDALTTPNHLVLIQK